jgi:hypothetical protein
MRRTQGQSPDGNAGTGDIPPPGPLQRIHKKCNSHISQCGPDRPDGSICRRLAPDVDQAVETRITAFQSPVACLFVR